MLNMREWINLELVGYIFFSSKIDLLPFFLVSPVEMKMSCVLIKE